MTEKRTTLPLPVQSPTSAPANTTEPGPPPRHRDDTDPMTLPPVVTGSPSRAARINDTQPDLAPPPAAAAHVEAESFLRRFLRPPRPPAPVPAQRASSDGGGFVAHYAETRPARRTRGEDAPPGVHVLQQLAEIARAPQSDSVDLAAHRDLPTTVPGRAQFRRRIRWGIGAACVVIGVAVSALIFMRASSPPSPATALSTPATTASAPVVSPPTATSPMATSLPIAPSPSASTPSAPTASATSAPRPAASAPSTASSSRGASSAAPRPAGSSGTHFMSEDP